MNFSGDKLIKATVILLGSNIAGTVIYEGFDFILLDEACRQACVNGVRQGNAWHPPHKIDFIKLEVKDYKGNFAEYVRENNEST